MKKEILFLIPENTISQYNIGIYASKYPDILFKSIHTIRPEEEIKDLLSENDFKIAVARGESINILKKFFQEPNIVPLEVTLYDLVDVISNIKNKDTPIALVSTALKIDGLDFISKVFNIKILNYLLTPREKLDDAIYSAVKNGAGVIIGGSFALRRIKALKIKIENSILSIEKETVEQAINEAHLLLDATKTEQRDREYLLKSLDSLSEGLVFVDKGTIRLVNAEAERLLGISRSYFFGFSDEHLPAEFFEWTKEEKKENEKVVAFRGRNMLVSRSEKEGDGASYILSLQSQDQLKDKEGELRARTYSKRQGSRHYRFSEISGTGQSLADTIRTAKSYAHRDSNVLITGESGCGKEVFAQSIHYESARKGAPFIAVNCASFTKDLVRSELFGYVEGAFTGALKQGKAGIFEAAKGGTVFLDEIAEMDYALQASLLRVLQEGYVVRMGSYENIPVDVRVIAATNKDLESMAMEGKFRIDLYFRLNVLPLRIPPLRDRKSDIYPLLLHFLNWNLLPGQQKFSLDAKARALLESYRWPGNVRELGNVAQRLMAMSTAAKITEPCLRQALLLPSPRPARDSVSDVLQAKEKKRASQLEEIRRTVAECDGNLCEAARKLGIDRTTLWRRMKRGAQGG